MFKALPCRLQQHHRLSRPRRQWLWPWVLRWAQAPWEADAYLSLPWTNARPSRICRAFPPLPLPYVSAACITHYMHNPSAAAALIVHRRSGLAPGALLAGSTVEWGRLGVDQKLEFSTTKLDNGVRINYFLTPAQARERGLAGVQQDGGFELTVDGNAIVGRADPGRIDRKASEEVIWQRLLLQITKGIAMERAGARPDIGTVRGVYPCSMEKEIAYMALRRASDSLWKRY